MLLKLLRGLVRRNEPVRTQTDSVRLIQTRHEAAPAESAVILIEQARNAIDQGELAVARHCLDEATRLGTESIDLRVMLASVQAQQGDLAGAEEALIMLLERHPDAPHARNALGNVLRLQGKAHAAIEQYDRALDAMPELASAHSNRALCLQDLGRFEDALSGFGRGLQIDPADLTIATNLAALEFDLGQNATAQARLDAVLHTDPGFEQAHWVLAFALLRSQEYERGWKEYEWRDRDAGRSEPTPDLPEWQGDATDGVSLLVCAEQGLGDQIMFASCIEDISACVGELVIECDPRLVPIFARSFPAAHVYPHQKKATQPWLRDGLVPASKTWLGSLPQRCRSARTAFPERGRYLTADSASVEEWRTRLAALGPGLKVGISWRGGTLATRGELRSIPLVEWLPVLRLPGVHFIDLQYGNHDAERQDLERRHSINITHWPQALGLDYDATAALVEALDLVISVQTSIVHLAGAMGKKVWVLVPRVAEWRYGSTGDRMPWYPSVRLLRQTDKDWSEVLAKIATELVQFHAQCRHSAGTYL